MQPLSNLSNTNYNIKPQLNAQLQSTDVSKIFEMRDLLLEEYKEQFESLMQMTENHFIGNINLHKLIQLEHTLKRKTCYINELEIRHNHFLEKYPEKWEQIELTTAMVTIEILKKM